LSNKALTISHKPGAPTGNRKGFLILAANAAWVLAL